MTYEEARDYLFNSLPVFQSQGPGAYKPGLDTARILAEAFGNPHEGYQKIHIGGTNGKGSTSHMTASILREAGYKTGLYTSPHLVDFRERIRVDGEMMPREAVVDFVERYLAMNLPCRPSFFELTTIMAFEWFKKSGVDYAVIEVGLGGRLDTTNIMEPCLTAVTNVSLDHMALLGNTEPEIAREKAGIFKPGVKAFVFEAEGDVRKVFEDAANTAGAPVTFVQDQPLPYRRRADGKWIFALHPDEEPWVVCDLDGDCQPMNIRGVIELAHNLPVDDGAIFRGLETTVANTGLMGRWMTLRDASPRIICDTSHNIGAWQYLAPRLGEMAEEERTHAVMGFVNDKDVSHIFERLPRSVRYFFATPSVPRGRKSSELLALARSHGLDAQAYDTVAEALAAAQADADVVFVGGSTFIVADLLSQFS